MRFCVSFLALSCLVVGCAHLAPTPRCAAYSDDEWRVVEDAWLEVWDSFAPESTPLLREHLEQLVVTCEDKPLAFDGQWFLLGDTPSRSHVVIATTLPGGERMPLHITSYGHELMHIALWLTEGDPDLNHSQAGGPWSDEHTLLIVELMAQLDAP